MTNYNTANDAAVIFRDFSFEPLARCREISDLCSLCLFLSASFERGAGVLSRFLAAPRTCVRGLAGDRLPRLTTVHRAFHPSAEQHHHLRLLCCLLLHRSATRCCPVSRQLRGAWLLPLSAARSVSNKFAVLFTVLAHATYFSSFPDFCSVFALSLPLPPLSRSLFLVALVSLNTDHAFARTCILVYPCSPLPLFWSYCGYPSFFSALPSASFSSSCTIYSIPLSVIAFRRNRTSCMHGSTSHRGAHRI